MTTYDEERIASLLRRLPPAPEAWVHAAQVLPGARLGLDAIVARAEAGAAERAAILADLAAALEAEGLEPSHVVLERLRKRLQA
jgi:hypothetical protein